MCHTHSSSHLPDPVVASQVGHFVEATRDLDVNDVILEDDAAVLGPDHDTVPVCLECLSREGRR